MMRVAARLLLAWAAVCMTHAAAQVLADAPYVTTPPSVVEAMLKLGGVGANDYVIDLGSGDGRIVLAAAQRFGARGHGIELDPNLVRTANREAQRLGIAERARFVTENIFHADLSRASVITMYMGASVNRRVRPLLFKLKPGTRVVSHEFDLGNWAPDVKINVAAPDKTYGAPNADVLLWYVPADFSGSWSWRLAVDGAAQAHDMTLTQKYQKAEGAARIAGRPAAIGKLEIKGDTLRFVMGGEVAGKAAWREFEGRITGDTISGAAVTIVEGDSAARHGASVPWRATRTARGRMDIEAGTEQPFGSGVFTKEQQ